MIRNKLLFVILVGCLSFSSCKEEESIGEIVLPEPDYVLPQGKSSVDEKIEEFYNNYGTYILYEYSKRDFEWTFVSAGDAVGRGTMPDPQYVEPLFELLQEVWFDFYPDEFKKEYLPYKIFLTDTLIVRGQQTYARIVSNQIAVGNCNEKLTRYTAEDKIAYKNALNKELWMFSYVNELEFPQEYFDVTDYVTPLSSTSNDENYYYKRGFWVRSQLTEYYDLFFFFNTVLGSRYEKLSERMETYPLLKKKYNIMRDFLIKKYGIDIRKIQDVEYD